MVQKTYVSDMTHLSQNLGQETMGDHRHRICQTLDQRDRLCLMLQTPGHKSIRNLASMGIINMPILSLRTRCLSDLILRRRKECLVDLIQRRRMACLVKAAMAANCLVRMASK